MDVQKAIEQCYSVKKYLSKKPPITLITNSVNTAHLAQTAGNVQPNRYVIIDNSETINKIADASQQDFIKHAPYLIIICSDSDQVIKLFGKRADEYIKHNSGAVGQNLLLSLINNGLAGSLVAIFSENLIHQITGIPDSIKIELIITAGYDLKKSKVKTKFNHSLVNRIFYNSWGNKFYKPFGFIRRSDV